MSKEIKADDIIFNFFKQICDEKDDIKCVELGNNWINAMENNLTNMEANLKKSDLIKHHDDIKNNKEHLKSLKDNTAIEWRKYSTQCMIEILEHKAKV
jgi:hypothetical protein